MPTSASASASDSSSVAVGTTRGHYSDLLPRLTSSDGEVQVKALRELKNRIIGNRTKKLSFIKLGLVPAVADILASKVAQAEADRGSDLLIQSAAVIGSFACGFDAGVRAVLDAGVFPSLVRLLSHRDEKVNFFFSIQFCLVAENLMENAWEFHLKIKFNGYCF